MNAAVVNIPGQAPKYQSFPDPVPEEGEALIHVRAAGLHPLVKSTASGSHYSSSATGPAVPGIDGVGLLDDGRRVYFVFVRKPWGTMAEMAAAPRARMIPLPDSLDDVTAAAIANPGMPAWLSLKNRAALAAEAATGIDVIVDYLWGRPTELVLESLAKGFKLESTRKTRLVEIGSSAGPTITLPAAILRSVDLTLLGSGFGAVSLETILAGISTLFSLAAAGTLTVAAEPIPLKDVEEGWNRVEKGRRIVFTVKSS